MAAPVCIMSVGQHNPAGFVMTVDEYKNFTKAGYESVLSQLDESKEEDKAVIRELRDACDWLCRLADNSGIKKRHYSLSNIRTWYRDQKYSVDINTRHKYWKDNCPDLHMAAAEKTLKSWGGSKERIGNVISHSTGGWHVPGLAHHLIFNLELSEQCRAVPLMFGGCVAGMTSMATGFSIAQSDPNKVVLVTTGDAFAHFPTFGSPKNTKPLAKHLMISNALFGEGSAGVIMGVPTVEDIERSTSGGYPLWEADNFDVRIIPGTAHALGMGVFDDGGEYLEVFIKRELPVHINSALSSNFGAFFKNALPGVDVNDADYSIHPGGKKLLELFARVAESYGHKSGKESVKYSMRSLYNYGNMSSTSVIHILGDILPNTEKNHVYAMAMGPGVSIEYCGLKRFDPSTSVNMRASSGQSVSTTGFWIAIVALLAMVLSGITLNDIVNFL